MFFLFIVNFWKYENCQARTSEAPAAFNLYINYVSVVPPHNPVFSTGRVRSQKSKAKFRTYFMHKINLDSASQVSVVYAEKLDIAGAPSDFL